MGFDHEIHHRRSIRLKGYEYSHNGAYFVTICSLKKECIFSTVGAGLVSAQYNTIEIKLKEPGKIILEKWNKIPERFGNVFIDDLVIMPNHIHAIIIIDSRNRVDARPTPTLSDIICALKSECVTDYIKYINDNNLITSGKLWQRNYYEHIIRNDNEFAFYRCYIKTNPANWEEDEYFVLGRVWHPPTFL